MDDRTSTDGELGEKLRALHADALAHLKAGSAPRDTERGLALLEAASVRGHAPAAEMCAVFDAMGIGRLQNWPRALRELQRAAELGSVRAQRQLLLLRDRNSFPAAIPPTQPGGWSKVKNEVDITAALHVGVPEKLCEAPRIRVLRQFATEAECEWLIERATERMQRAAVIDRSSGALAYDAARTNAAVEFQLDQLDVIVAVIRARIANATKLPGPLFEPTQILHYAVGQEFRAHYDFIDPTNPALQEQLRSGQRIATFLLYLNSCYEGGATLFPLLNLAHRGQAGDAFFFANVGHDNQPEPNSLHAGQPPTSGEKWVLSQWIRDRAGPVGNGETAPRP